MQRNDVATLLVIGFLVLFSCFAGAQEVLMQEDFSSNASGWYENESVQVRNGRYEFSNSGGAEYTWMSGNMDDGLVETDVTWLSGDASMGFGLVFRLVDAQNFYFIWLTGDGGYTLGKVIDNHAVPIQPWTQSDSIRVRGENHIRIELCDFLINVLINGQEVAVLRDESLSQGGYGFYTHQGAHVAYDNFRVVSDSPFTLHMPRNGSMTRFRGMNGKTFALTLRGDAGGEIWGSDIYTDDSNIAAAAVHSGVLADGEMGTVLITVLAGQDSYTASERNGVSSKQYGSWHGSYRLERLE